MQKSTNYLQGNSLLAQACLCLISFLYSFVHSLIHLIVHSLSNQISYKKHTQIVGQGRAISLCIVNHAWSDPGIGHSLMSSRHRGCLTRGMETSEPGLPF